MPRTTHMGFVAAATAVALAVAGCGGSNDNSAWRQPAAPSAAAHAKGGNSAQATVSVATTSLGNILVNSRGLTLYVFEKDSAAKSTCNASCAASWPPLSAAGKLTAGSGASASLLGTINRSDGRRQVTYDGHPLYLFAGDTHPGDTNGEGLTAFGAAWLAVSVAGDPVSGDTASARGTGG